LARNQEEREREREREKERERERKRERKREREREREREKEGRRVETDGTVLGEKKNVGSFRGPQNCLPECAFYGPI
jgi:hypothetical protein